MDSKNLIAKRTAQELAPHSIVNLGIGIPTLLANYLNKEDYYLCFYQNPFFWFVNLSPMIVYIRRYQSEMDSSNQLLKINKKMNYSFKRKSHCKYFKRAVKNVLTNFIEKHLVDSNKTTNTFISDEITSEG